VLRIIRAVLILFLLTHAGAAFAQGNTPAHQALKRFSRGVNFGNYLEAPRGQNWGMRYDTRDLDNVKKEGFDHIRFPIAWHHYAGPEPQFKLEPEIFAKVDLLVTNALTRGLNMIINIHHFDDFTTDPAANTKKFYALWQQIAEHYAAEPDALAFELLNEPKDKATTESINPIFAEATRIIRKTNPNRTIFLGPSKWNSLDEVPKLKLPDDNNLIVTVHSYEPFNFTHQGTSWAGDSVATTGIRYPGPPAKPLQPDPKALGANASLAKWFDKYNHEPTSNNPSGPKAFVSRMEKVAAWAKEHNRPIHLGEFGAYEKADRESRVRFYADMRETAERLGWGWAIWDWKAGFKYWDGDKPVAGMHEALLAK
jgi:endoglucanase